MTCVNTSLYLSVRRSGFGGKRRKRRRCSGMVLGSGAATLGICKVMGGVVRGKVRIRVGFTPYGGEVCRNEEVVQNVEIPLRSPPCGKLHAGGYPS